MEYRNKNLDRDDYRLEHCFSDRLLDGQPGGVGGEAARGEMVESNAVLEVANCILDLGVAPMVGLQFQGWPRVESQEVV